MLVESYSIITTAAPKRRSNSSALSVSSKRLIRARNPEQDINGNITLFDPITNNSQWSVKYDYDNNSNLTQKTDSRSPAVVTDYFYDALNRATNRNYSDGTPAVTYIYDDPSVFNSKGRLTRVSSSVSVYDYLEYDAQGRVKQSKQTTGGQQYLMSYEYNLAGGMTVERYPSYNATQKEIRTSYDIAGRITSVSRYQNGVLEKSYATGFSYAAHGAVSGMQLGNTKWEHTLFNSRLQPIEIGLGVNSSDSSLLKLQYGYGTTNNNGNILTQTITAPNQGGGNLILTQSYSYDALNRLQSASENSGTSFSRQFSYDRWGNMWVSGHSGITPGVHTPQSSAAFNQSTNRLSTSAFPNVVYDGAGNLTRDAVASTFDYDGENRQTRSTVGGVVVDYSYDGDGRRVKKVKSGSPQVTTVFVYNVAGQLIAEYTTDPVPPPAGGGGTSYLTSDHLGSTRVVTGTNPTQIVKARYDYLPFGEEITSSIGARNLVAGYGGADSTRQKFTSKERDSESGLDYFLARYYSSAQGRFTSADEPLAGQYEDDPQSWNLYQYARNNPLLYIDPTGNDYIVYDQKGNKQIIEDDELENYTLIWSDESGSFATFEDVNGVQWTGYFQDHSKAHNPFERSNFVFDPPIQFDVPNVRTDTAADFNRYKVPDSFRNFNRRDNSTNFFKKSTGSGGRIGPFPKDVRRDVVRDVLRNKRPLSDLTQKERELAAEFYEKQVAPNVGQQLKEWAEKYNLARAKYLREGGEHPGGTITEFIKKQGGQP